MASKTTLSIAHRIETIENSDLINVFEKGEIVEYLPATDRKERFLFQPKAGNTVCMISIFIEFKIYHSF